MKSLTGMQDPHLEDTVVTGDRPVGHDSPMLIEPKNFSMPLPGATRPPSQSAPRSRILCASSTNVSIRTWMG
jgi:hypothetical protein